MLRTLLNVCGALLLFGTLQATPDFLGDRGTLSLSAAESVVFVGITGDYKAMPADHLTIYLSEEKDLEFVGESIRAMGDPTRRVFAVRTDDAKKLLKTMKAPLKKKGFKAYQLEATVVEPLKQDGKALRTAQRTVEADKKVWTMWSTRRTPGVWVFHETKLSGKQVEGLFRKTEAKVAFYHQEFEFSTTEGADYPALTAAAEEKLDALRVAVREEKLVLDLYLRDLNSMLILENANGTKTYLCPDIVKPFLGTGAAASLDWAVTLESEGFPFVD